MKIRKILAALSVIVLFVASTALSSGVELAEMLLKAHDEHAPMPVLSTQIQEFDVATAYAIQKTYIEKRLLSDQLAGFKAGLTSEPGQKKFGVDAPLAGLLLASGKLTGSPALDSSEFHLLMLETEIGFVFKEPLSEPLESVAELQDKVESVMPVIEFPDLGYTDMTQLKGVDIIATNIAAEKFLIGDVQNFNGQDVNAVNVTLSREGEEVNAGKGSDALGDQWQAALWLVNTLIEQGWSLEAGQVILTGALGNMIPGKAGRYIADYGEFGRIEFEIR